MKPHSKLIGFLTGYEKAEETFESSHSGRKLGQTFFARNICGANTRLSHALYSGRLSDLFSAISRRFSSTVCRAYGMFLLAFGSVTLLLNFAEYYFREEEVEVFAPLMIGAICAILSIPAFLSELPIGVVLQKIPLTDFVLYDFLCIKRASYTKTDRGVRPILLLLAGIVLAVIGYFTSPFLIVMILLSLLFLWISVDSPETPFLLSLVLLPYLPLLPHGTVALVVIVGVCILSFARKVILGNRVFHFEQYDFFLLLLGVILLISGVVNGGLRSLPGALTYVAMFLGYPLAGNLLTNQRLMDRASEAIAFSSVPVALLAVYQYVSGVAEFRWLDSSFLESIDGRAVSTFNNPNVLAVFLLAGTMFSLMLAQKNTRLSKKIAYVVFAAVNVAALVFTWSRGAWIALGFGLIACLIIRFRHHPGLLLTLLAALPYGVFFLPVNLITRLLSAVNLNDSSISYRLSIWRSSLRMLADRFLIGVGPGEEAFSEAFKRYAEEAVVAPHAHNLFLVIGCEGGVLALICFTALLIVRARHISTYRRYLRSSTVRTVTLFSCATVFTWIVYGMTDNIFYYLPLCYLFFAVFGIGSTALRIGKKDYDDRFGYADGEHTYDAAAVNIDLSL